MLPLFILTTGLICSIAMSDATKRYNLTMCAMVRDEMPYIVEWIEHHRRQGVDRFLLYDDGSLDDTVLIPHLYRSKGFINLVELFPLNPFRRNKLAPQIGAHYMDRQLFALDHCNRVNVGVSKWVIVVDVDEFMYAPEHGSIWTYLESLSHLTEGPVEESMSQVYVHSVRYGTAGIQNSFQGAIRNDPFLSTATVSIDRPELGFPTISTANPFRAPHPNLDDDFDARYNETCRDHADPYGCIHANGKSVWRPERCALAYVHWCTEGNLTGMAYTADIAKLRVNHYAFRSREHVEGLLDLMKPDKMAAYENFDASWFSTVLDPLPDNLTAPLRAALDGFIDWQINHV